MPTQVVWSRTISLAGLEPTLELTRTVLLLIFYIHSELAIFFTIYQLTFYRIYFRIGATYHLALFIGNYTQGNITLKIGDISALIYSATNSPSAFSDLGPFTTITQLLITGYY